MVWDDLKPRDILTPGAFRNAAAAVLAVSGSINCIKHLQATAVEAGVDVDVFALFNDLGEQVPVLERGRPERHATRSMPSRRLAALWADEAARTAARSSTRSRSRAARSPRTSPRLSCTTTTSFGRSIARSRGQAFDCRPARIAGAGKRDREARRAKRQLEKRGSAVQRWSTTMSPRGDRRDPAGRGEARARAGRRADGTEGRTSDGGLGVASGVCDLTRPGFKTRWHSCRDGQLSGLCNKGLTVAEVSPESAVGGPLSLVAERRPDHDRRGRKSARPRDFRNGAFSTPRASWRTEAPEIDGLSVHLPAQCPANVDGCRAGQARLTV